MFVLLLIVFSALFAAGQAAWVDASRQARQKQQSDDLAGAVALRWEALRLAEKQLGPLNTQLTPLLADLAMSLHLLAQDAEAEPLAQRAVAIAKESGDRRLMGLALNCLGIVLGGEGQKARAEPVLRRSVSLMEPDSLDFARASNNLATLYLDTHQFAKAEEEMEQALPIYEQRLGPRDPEFAMASGNMFTVLAEQHRAAEGEPYLRRALAIGEKTFPGRLQMANLQLGLATLEESRDHFNEAASLLKTAIATQEKVLGPDHPLLAYSLAGYARVLRHIHQKTEAKKAMNRAHMILKTRVAEVK